MHQKLHLDSNMTVFIILGKGGQAQDRNSGQYGYVSPYPPYPNGSSPLVSVAVQYR